MNLQAFGRGGSSLLYFCVALIGKNAGFLMTGHQEGSIFHVSALG